MEAFYVVVQKCGGGQWIFIWDIAIDCKVKVLNEVQAVILRMVLPFALYM